MFQIEFKGFFECRLATDNDHYEEARGTSAGWTFATPDEPDLDRIIRLQPGSAIQRRPGVDIGVSVSRVLVNGTQINGHPLVGAKVNLKDNPVFEGQNGNVAGDAQEPIFPFHIEIAGENIQISREMQDQATGEPKLELANGGQFSQALFAETGIGDPSAYRDVRLQAIDNRMAVETDQSVLDGLQQRKTSIENAFGSPALMWGPVPAQVFVNYDYNLSYPPGVVDDIGGSLPNLDLSSAWRFECNIGAWDADVLSGFLIGNLQIPIQS